MSRQDLILDSALAQTLTPWSFQQIRVLNEEWSQHTAALCLKILKQVKYPSIPFFLDMLLLNNVLVYHLIDQVCYGLQDLTG